MDWYEAKVLCRMTASSKLEIKLIHGLYRVQGGKGGRLDDIQPAPFKFFPEAPLFGFSRRASG